MPVRNELTSLARALNSVLTQDYPSDRIELLIVDGMSDDGTREFLLQIMEQRGQPRNNQPLDVAYSGYKINVLDNPARVVPNGLNMGLGQARGRVIIIVSGHCEIASDYVSRCVKVMEETGADCVGGPMVTKGETRIAHAIALAQSSFFGVGGVAFRTGRDKPCQVDTVAFGAYRREVFDQIGCFDEELIRNQDDELNFRLTQAGGKIWLDPSIQSVYYSRASLRSLWTQYFRYGFYKVRVIQKRGAIPSWRHLVPGTFVMGLGGCLFLSLAYLQPFWALSVAGAYLPVLGVVSVWMARKDWRTFLLLLLAFLTLHLGYGTGFLWGLWRWKRGFALSIPCSRFLLRNLKRWI
jgi:GT2 family glycosyltransferase